MDIDIVYMWVDGNDPVWRRKKAAFMKTATSGQDEETSGNCRYRQNDELRYAIRSAAINAPWIRNIYIITDNQTPSWLDTGSPGIHIIDHKDIIDNRYLPLFNSSAIELNVCNIPGLAEHFLLGNDDTFFGEPVKPSFFFNPDGRPIVRVKNKKIVSGFSHYQDMLMNMVRKIQMRYGKCCRLAPHHNIDAYRKSDWIECLKEFSSELQDTMTHRFRDDNDLHRHIISLWALKKNRATLEIVSRWNRIHGLAGFINAVIRQKYADNSKYISIRTPDFDRFMLRHNPILFNMNDTPQATDEDRSRMSEFLEHRFPERCQFEKVYLKDNSR